MTKKSLREKTNTKKRNTEDILFVFLTLCLTLLVLCRPNDTAEAVRTALSLCAKTVIPSLFPFMVISELIASLGIARWAGKIFSKPFHALFGINGSGASALILGILCGFPIGAKCAVSLYGSGQLSKEQTERLLCF